MMINRFCCCILLQCIFGLNTELLDWTLPGETCNCVYDSIATPCPCCVEGGCPCPPALQSYLCVQCGHWEECDQDNRCDDVTQDYCYIHLSFPQTWNTAQDICSQEGGLLAAVKYETQGKEFVQSLLGSPLDNEHRNIWIGAHVDDYLWRWTFDGESVQDQGCFTFEQTENEGGSFPMTTPEFTEDACVQTCEESFFDYAGIYREIGSRWPLFNEVYLTPHCHCWDKLISATEVDNSKCEEKTIMHTKDQNRYVNLRSVTGATFQQWGISEHLGNCVFLDHIQEYRWVKSLCSERRSYICQYDDSMICSQRNNRLWTGSVCISLHREQITWHRARSMCESMEGDLVKIRSRLVQEWLTEFLSGTDLDVWIGLTNRHWRWLDGSDVKWNNFTEVDHVPFGEPSCASLSLNSGYTWNNIVPCDTNLPFSCQLGKSQSKKDTAQNAIEHAYQTTYDFGIDELDFTNTNDVEMQRKVRSNYIPKEELSRDKRDLEGSVCEDEDCKNGGNCTSSVEGSGVYCICPPEFIGCDCGIRHPCTLQSCFNGATCSLEDQTGNFTCKCVSGYEGDDCYTNINDCAGFPCTNGGTCEDKVNGYDCHCRQGFDGRNCLNDIDECASNPCQNNATCSQGKGSYDCVCRQGYEGINCEIDINECVEDACNYRGVCTDHVASFICSCDQGFFGDRCEIDLDECLENPCQNDGICEDRPGRAKCYCSERWGGETCDLKIEVTPVVYSVGPRFGPAAGGTLMTVAGKYLDELKAVTVIIGSIIECITISLNESHVIAQTPKVDENNSTIVNVNLTIIVELAGGIPVNTGDKFLYKGNPKIDSIVPLETIQSGGTTLTVSGETLDAIAFPVMEIKMILSWIVSRNPDVIESNQTIYTSPCKVSDSGKMLCQTPEIEVPEVFNTRRKRSLENTLGGTKKEGLSSWTVFSRQKRQAEIGLEADGTFIVFYLGFRLDGVDTYKNLTESLPEYAKLAVYSEPEFVVPANAQDNPISFRPNTNQSIAIKGKDTDVGCTVDDYKINIGLGNCSEIYLTSNALFCYPPDEFPGQAEAESTTEGVVTITVYLGTEVSFVVGYIKYDVPEDCPPLVAIITPIVVCFVVIIIVQIFVTVVIFRKRNRKREPGGEGAADELELCDQTGDERVTQSPGVRKSTANKLMNLMEKTRALMKRPSVEGAERVDVIPEEQIDTKTDEIRDSEIELDGPIYMNQKSLTDQSFPRDLSPDIPVFHNVISVGSTPRYVTHGELPREEELQTWPASGSSGAQGTDEDNKPSEGYETTVVKRREKKDTNSDVYDELAIQNKDNWKVSGSENDETVQPVYTNVHGRASNYYPTQIEKGTGAYDRNSKMWM